ncbi:ferrous iron transport protein B [Candidatus Latescibacterota bacterium]
MAAKPIVIALAGNPNSGKSSLFNFITGSRQHVGNYPGVTVELKEGTLTVDNIPVTFVDLPGTYNLSPYSIEEYVTRQEILSPRISGIIVVVDTMRLERNLYLVSQIIEIGKPVVLALNMYDEFKSSGSRLDIEQLSQILGIPCVKTVGNRGKGITELMATALKAVSGEVPAIGKPPHYSHEMEHAIEETMVLIRGKTPYNERWTAINLLLYGKKFLDKEKNTFPEELYNQIGMIRERLEHIEGLTVTNIITSWRYGYASGAVTECLKQKDHHSRSTSDKIDEVLTHKFLGFPIFLALLWLMFQATFSLGALPGELIEIFFEKFGELATYILPHGFIQSLVVEGIISGVGGVLVFLPNILILFFFISLFEDTGYMARSAFIMDRIMHFFGLHGKSFLPMLVGFGCSVPAVMATRILENRRDRLITMFVVPFMSCSARMPVYILLAGAFFSPRNAGNVIFSIYLIGILLSLIVAKVCSFARGPSTPFVMELPPYRMPTLRSILLHIWERVVLYVKKAGTIILAASIIMWFLMTYPKISVPENSKRDTTHTMNAVTIEHTFAGRFGKIIEPALKPLGLDWRMGVALTAGFAAKEVVVSTLGNIYSISGEDGGKESSHLIESLRNDPKMNPVTAYGLMLFVLIYVPCLAVLAIIKREAGGWKWVGIMILYTTSLAWLVSFTFIKTAQLLM